MKVKFKFYVTRIHLNKSHAQTSHGFIKIDLMDPENQGIQKVLENFFREVERESQSFYWNHVALECTNGMYLVYHDCTLTIGTEIGSLEVSKTIDCGNKRLTF